MRKDIEEVDSDVKQLGEELRAISAKVEGIETNPFLQFTKGMNMRTVVLIYLGAQLIFIAAPTLLSGYLNQGLTESQLEQIIEAVKNE